MAHTILVVDDDPDDMEITLRTLDRSGRNLHCIPANRGEAAIAHLIACDALPALVLLDLKMPGMSGLDTLQRLRGEARLRHLPVVMLTNSTLDSDRAAALAAGANAFVPKAFDLDQFGREIGRQLDRWLPTA